MTGKALKLDTKMQSFFVSDDVQNDSERPELPTLNKQIWWRHVPIQSGVGGGTGGGGGVNEESRVVQYNINNILFSVNDDTQNDPWLESK